jgi:hypothetical protein
LAQYFDKYQFSQLTTSEFQRILDDQENFFVHQFELEIPNIDSRFDPKDEFQTFVNEIREKVFLILQLNFDQRKQQLDLELSQDLNRLSILKDKFLSDRYSQLFTVFNNFKISQLTKTILDQEIKNQQQKVITKFESQTNNINTYLVNTREYSIYKQKINDKISEILNNKYIERNNILEQKKGIIKIHFDSALTVIHNDFNIHFKYSDLSQLQPIEVNQNITNEQNKYASKFRTKVKRIDSNFIQQLEYSEYENQIKQKVGKILRKKTHERKKEIFKC